MTRWRGEIEGRRIGKGVGGWWRKTSELGIGFGMGCDNFGRCLGVGKAIYGNMLNLYKHYEEKHRSELEGY